MTPRIPQRAAWTLLVVVIFIGLLTRPIAGQQSAAADPPDDQPTTAPADQAAPASQPAESSTTQPTTYPATQEAQERFAQYRQMQEAMAKNGKPGAAKDDNPAPAKKDRPTRSKKTKRAGDKRPKPSKEEWARMQSEAQERERESGQESQESDRRASKRDAARAGRTSPARPGRAARKSSAGEPDDTPDTSQQAGEAAAPVELARKPLSPPFGTTRLEVEPDAESEPGERHVTPLAPASASVDEEHATPPPAAAAEEEGGDEQPVAAQPEPDDGRSYFISFDNMPWEDVVRHYAKLVGKPIMGEPEVYGALTYESERRFTKEEMLDELNFLLMDQEAKFVVETVDYIYVVPLSELDKFIPLDRMYASIEQFEAAELRDLEFCATQIRIADRSAEEVRDMLSPGMPDHALPVVVGNTNKIKITGLAQDVRRFMGLLEIIETAKFDPRETCFIKVETNVREVERMLREMLGVKQSTRHYDREQRKFVTEGGDSDILIIADERTKNLIVKATPAEIEEIKEIVKLIDEKPDIGEFTTTVIPVRYGNASDIARLLNEILRQEQGEQTRTATRTPTRTARTRAQPQRRTAQQAQTAAPEDIIVEDIYERARKTVRIVADERTNNLVVYANEDGRKRVQEILDQIDQPVPANFRTFVLEHADAVEIQPTIDQIARGTSGTSGRSRTSLTIVADENLNALHVVAEREDMTRVEQIIKELDIEIPEDDWHFVELTNITPSEAVRIITPFLGSGAAAPRRTSRGRRGPVQAAAAATSQTIALDAANTLIVICSAEEWEDVERVLQIADEQAISDKPEIRFFDIANGNPESIASTVMQLYGNYQHPVLGRSRTFVDTLGQQIVVQAVTPALEEIESLVASLDIKVEGNPLVIVPLEHADATDVLQQVQPLMGISGGRGRRGGGGAGETSVQADAVTNSLIIQADATTLERVKQYVTEYEAQVAAQTPERKAYTLQHAPARDVINAINSFFGSGGRRGRYTPTSSRVTAVPVGSQIIVDAPAAKQREVAALIEQLDTLSDQGITTLLVKLPGADVRNIAARLTNAFREQVRQQAVTARFEPDTTTETILMTCSKDVLPDAEKLLAEYKELTSEHVWQSEFYQLQHASADDTSRWLREQLMSLMSQQMSQSLVRQIKVTADMRTNRIFINAPQLAVKQGLELLKQYDTPVEQQPEPPMDVWTVNLPGLDVRNLASQLQRNLNELMRDRTDRLRATVTADQLTNNLIITSPTDMKPKIDELIATFSEQTEDLALVQKFVDIKEADANYVASQVRNILGVRMRSRGSIANQINIQVDTRLNRVILNAPKVAIEEAESLIAQLDQKSTAERQMHTLALENADANTVLGVLRTIFSEKIRAHTLQISVEPLTNALIVGGSKEDFDEIANWAKELDTKAGSVVAEQKIFELINANPWEVNSVLQQTFVHQRRGVVVPPGQEIKTAIIAGRSIIVTAPPEKMNAIADLIAQLDEIGQDEMVTRRFTVPGFGTQLNQFARNIQDAVNSKITGRELRIRVTPVPAADTLIVTATEKYLPEVEQAMEQFKDLYEPLKLETISLVNGDANTVYQALTRVLQEPIRAGKMQLSVEGMTNSIIARANEEDLAEIRDWVAKFEETFKTAIVEPRIFELQNANPWEVRSILETTFVPPGRTRRQGGMEIRFDIVGGKSIVAKAPAEKMKEIESLITKLDEVVSNKAEMRTYELTGMGNRLNEFARQLATAMNQQVQARERRVAVTAWPPADTLIVTALPDQFEQVEQLMEQLKPLMEVAKTTTAFFKLEYVDASQVAGTVQNLVQTAMRTGGRSSRGTQEFSVTADPRTNRLIVFAPESILPDVRAMVEQLDVEVEEDNVVTIELKYADPWETRNMINDVFGNRGSRRGQAQTEQVYVAVNNNTLVVTAPPKKLEQIQDLLAKVDVSNPNQLQIKMYELKVLNATQVAAQVQMFLRSVGRVSRRGEMQPGAFAEPTTNTLVVMAPGDQMPFIDTLISQIEAKVPDEAVTQTYVLKFARADQVQQHVDQMLRVKVAEKEGDVRGRRAQQRTVVMADPTTNRLFVFAPSEYQELAAELIKMVDTEVDTGEIIHIVRLENADATQLAQTVSQTMQGNSARSRGSTPLKVNIVADAGSNSILLSGLPKDVAEVESLISDLEVTYDTIPELQYFTLEHALTYDVADALRAIFPPGRNPSEDVNVTEDDYYNKLLVTANRRKMRQVEAIIEQLDVSPYEEDDFLFGGKDIYFVEITRGDAIEIAYAVEDLLPPPERGGPQLEPDWFGDYIQVICRPSEYDRIERLIRQFEKKAKPEIVVRARDFSGDKARLLQYLQERELPFDYEEPPAELMVPESIIIDLHPEDEAERTGRGSENAPATSMSGGAPHVFGGVVLTTLVQDREDPADRPPRGARPGGMERGRPPQAPPGRPPQNIEAQDEVDDSEEPFERRRATIQILPDGRMIIRGPLDAVDELEDAIDLFEEDLSRGDVIRIFRFRYGDVNAASRILDMMFNTRQVRVQQQQQRQQPGQRGRQPGGKDGDQSDERQSMMQQIQQMIGGGRGQQGGGTAGGTQIRIATDASHNYVIVKCDEALLPDIVQLLRELDIPPADVDLEVIQLKNLEATETANNIKQVLGISGTRGGRTQPQQGGQRSGQRNAQQQLMEMIQQQMVSIGEGSAKIESVEIVPNSITNSLLVSAPQDVMEIIKTVINDLEGLEGGDVTVIKHYPLSKAKVDDVLPLLQEIFEAAGSSGGGGGRGGPRGGGSSPANLGSVTISGDPRNNTIIFVAQAKDVETVYEQIQKLDIEGAISEVEMYVCKFGDAVSIAEVVEEMFAESGGAGRGGRRGARGATSGGTNLEVRITAESATNTILVFAPVEKRELILSQIEKLDRGNRFDIREIAVRYAKPDKVADKLLQIFGGTGGSTATTGGGRRGGSRRQAAETPGRIVVIPDENAGKLLVRAPDEIFMKMQEITELLDKPSEQLLIRTFPLRHADASVVVDSVKAALTELMQFRQQLGQEGLDIDAFTAMADPRTNSVVVVGSQETFLFVEHVIGEIDGDIPPDLEKQFRIFVLDRADAEVVADAINAFAAGGGTTNTGGSSRGSRGRRGGFSSGASTTGPTLDIQAVADPTTNSVMVYGRLENIAKVEEAVIAKLEGALSDHLKFATIELEEAVPSELIPVIEQFLDRAAGGQSDTRGQRTSTAGWQRPHLQPNDNRKTIEIYGSERQIEEVRTLVARLDTADMRFNAFEIIPVPWGQDPFTLAATVQDLVNTSQQEIAERTGRQARLVTVSADEHSNAMIAFGDPSELALVRTVVNQLQEIRPEKPVTRVIELVNLSSEEAEQLISDLQQRRGSSGSSSIRRSGGSSSPRRSTTPSRSSGSRSRTGGSRRRSWNWNPGPNAPRLSAAPAGFATPFVGTKLLMPRLVGLLMTQDQPPREPAPRTAQDRPAAAQHRPAPPQDQPPAAQPRSPRQEKQQQMLNSISGQLRGEVVATPLDSRRIIVTGDEADVDFIVQMLLLMESSTPAPVIEVFTLENSKAAAIAPVLEETMQALINVGGGGDRVDNFSIVAEGRSNSLIVSASETNMNRIAELVEKLDITTGIETQPKLVPLKHIRASEAVQLLEDPIKHLNELREVPQDSQATVQAVDRSNAVLIVGTRPDIAEIEKLIQGIDIELPPEDDFSTAKVTIVDLTNAEAEALAETLTELIEMEQARSSGGGGGSSRTDMPLLRKLIFSLADGTELPPIDLDKPIVVFPEKGRNALVLFSSEQNAVALLEIVKLFDSLPKGEAVEVKSFALKHARAEQVAELLETMFDEGRKALVRPSDITSDDFDSGVMPPVPPGLAGRGLPYNVVVSHDERSNLVVVIGRQDAVLLAAGLVSELDRPSVDLSLKPYVLQLRNIQATTLQEKLEELLEERLKALGGDENLARDSAIVQADDRSNTLIVFASPEVYTMVEDLTLRLDRADPYSVVDSEFRRLTYADAAKLAGLLQTFFDKKKEAQEDVTEAGQEQVLFVFADARSNSLMLTGTRDYLLEANDLVGNLDQAFDPTVQFELRTVRLNSAANIAQLLEDMIAASQEDVDQEMQGTPIHVAADPYSNNLLLAASAEDMLMLHRWIDVLDRPSEPGRITRIIPLMRGSAQDMAQSAQDLFRTQVSGADEDVTVTYDETTNSVIAIGPPAVVNDIEEFIADYNAVQGAGAVVRMFKLEQADAEDAGELLRSILEGRGGSVGGGSSSSSTTDDFNQVMLIFQREHPDLGLETLKGLRKEVVVIDDLRTNSLVVTAPPETMPLMESLVTALDVPPDAAKIRVFKLRNSDAEEMMTMLDELFEAEQTSGGSGDDDQEYELSLGDLAAGGRQHLAFTVDTRTNSVIAAGTTGYLDLVDELILQLDSEPIQDRKTFVYEPRNNPAIDIQTVLTEYNESEQQLLDELEEEISVSRRQEREILAVASEETNRIVLGYDPRRESEVLALVRDLDQPPPQVMIQVLIVEVTVDDSLELGVEFAFQDLQYTKAGETDTNTFDFVGGTDVGAAGSGLGGFTFTITGADFNFLVRTLQNEGSLNIVSRPQIAAMDNQEARIEITNDVPYVSSTSTSTAGQTSTSVSRQDVGVILEVTPHINPDGFVRMEIRQEVSDLTGSTIDVGQGVTAPIFFKREAETTVTVKDSETVVLGGLITSSDETRDQKVPVLGDIPLLGTLFSNHSKDYSRTELLVILTPRVVRTVEDYRELSVRERDRAVALASEMLTDDMMGGLRVAPEDLKPATEKEELLGPFPKKKPAPAERTEPEPPDESDQPPDDDLYGPFPADSATADDPEQDIEDPDSYDVPISWARIDSTWERRSNGHLP